MKALTAQSKKDRPVILISFSGIDGAGKSTQIAKLLTYLREAQLSVLQLAFWDDVVAFPSLRAGFSHKFLDSTGEIGAPGKPAKRFEPCPIDGHEGRG